MHDRVIIGAAALRRDEMQRHASCLYDGCMAQDQQRRRSWRAVGRAVVEVAFIIFLFYSNLLMGEFNASGGHEKTLSYALHDIFTGTNFVIALTSALIGYLVVEFLRKKL